MPSADDITAAFTYFIAMVSLPDVDPFLSTVQAVADRLLHVRDPCPMLHCGNRGRDVRRLQRRPRIALIQNLHFNRHSPDAFGFPTYDAQSWASGQGGATGGQSPGECGAVSRDRHSFTARDGAACKAAIETRF
jgi:hypothetical protein